MSETVVITGASAGVGRATAHAFAAQGAQIGLIARGTQGLQAASAEVEKKGGKALALPLDMVQMPALNTPQFNWARNKMSRRPQPVPPIFQPEVAAEAILYAARSRRREVWVGGSSLQAIMANKFFPGLLDRYLAEKGYTGQLTDVP